MSLPTDKQIIALHRKYAPSEQVFNDVYSHSKIVRDIALQLIDRNNLDVDRRLVEVGSMLHDIGAYKFYEGGKKLTGTTYIRHGIVGYDILKDEGCPEELCRIASHHTGVGLTKEYIIAHDIGLPPADYTADTPEERIIMYADKFNSKAPQPRFVTTATYREWSAEYGAEMLVKFDAMVAEYGEPDLTELAKEYGYEIV